MGFTLIEILSLSYMCLEYKIKYILIFSLRYIKYLTLYFLQVYTWIRPVEQ